MKNSAQIILQQKDYIKEMKDAAVSFIDSIKKDHIETVFSFRK